MQIRVNRNIDNYKPDVFHGLDFSQTMHALGTVIAGASAFLFANFYLHLPQTIWHHFPDMLLFCVSLFRHILHLPSSPDAPSTSPCAAEHSIQ